MQTRKSIPLRLHKDPESEKADETKECKRRTVGGCSR